MTFNEQKGIKQSDLDLIRMVQRARMQHDAQAKPSEVAGVYWIEARCETLECPGPTPRAGQWVLNTTVDLVDELWEAIREATVDGKLGYKAKVTTAPRSGKGGDSRTIVVCTYDSSDTQDVQRIWDLLDALELDGAAGGEWRFETG
jgi:hypothetical protein